MITFYHRNNLIFDKIIYGTHFFLCKEYGPKLEKKKN